MRVIEEYIEVIIAVISVLTSVTFYLKVLINKIKEAKDLSNKELVTEELKALMKEAESLFKNGSDKKKYCLTKMRDFIKRTRIKFSSKKVDELLEELVGLTNEINIKKESRQE